MTPPLDDPRVSGDPRGSSSGDVSSSVGAEGQTGSAARLIAQLEAEAYGTWRQAFAEVYGR